MQKAIDKLRAEMDSPKSNAYIKVIGQFLIRHVEGNPTAAEKLSAADKSIAQSLDAMKAEAKKVQSGGMAMLTDAEGFAIVLTYFEIDGQPVTTSSSNLRPGVPVRKQDSTGFDVNLDDYL